MTSPTVPQYQNDKGQSYLMRIPNTGSTPTWDTYFGRVSDVNGDADQINCWEAKLPGLSQKAFGNITFNNTTNTAFATGGFRTNIVETAPTTGFFSQSSIASNPASAGLESFLASFANDGITNKYYIRR